MMDSISNKDEFQLHLELDTLAEKFVQSLRNNWVTSCDGLGLSLPQAFALLKLDEFQSMREIADKLSCDASNVTGLTDSLEELGYVERRPTPKDRRIKHIYLTEKGKDIQRKLQQAFRQESPIAKRLTYDEKLDFLFLLGKIVS